MNSRQHFRTSNDSQNLCYCKLLHSLSLGPGPSYIPNNSISSSNCGVIIVLTSKTHSKYFITLSNSSFYSEPLPQHQCLSLQKKSSGALAG